jgi:DTW domain-containing protein YfiP
MDHAVSRLRAECVARSRKPFVARGARSDRCPDCRVPAAHCLCALRPDVATRAGFCLLMHGDEPMKPSNTGWLVADVVADTHAFAWSRTQVDPRLTALLADPARRPYVVFPGEAAPSRAVRGIATSKDRRPLFVVLDATWAEARKMFRKSPYLDALPVLALDDGRPSRYRLRRTRVDANLCTAEVAARCLRLADEDAAADALDAWLDAFVDLSMRLRGR